MDRNLNSYLSDLQILNKDVRFQVFTAVTMMNAVFWDVNSLALVRTDFLEERSASIIRVTRICELGTMLAVASNRRTLRRFLRNVGSYKSHMA
jgi:hypothetical protein